MDKMTKDNSLMSGKGEPTEWITVNGAHIPIADGESKEQAVERFTAEQEQEEREKALTALAQVLQQVPNAKVAQLVQTLKQVAKVKMKDLATYIKNLKPVKLTINDDEIIAQFDKFSANKNVYTRGNSSHEGFVYKLNNINKLPSIIETSKYTHSTKEKGKDSPQHKGVKQWHYFINQIESDNGKYDVVVNVRDKGENKYVYEVAIRKKKP